MISVELPRWEVDRQFAEVRLQKESDGARVFSARRLQPFYSSVALKCMKKDATKKKDFLKEFYLNYYLGLHPNIITCYNEKFETSSSYGFVQELAPEGDLAKIVETESLGEARTKRVTEQIAFALEFIHKKNLVHRDVCTENIFVFDRELSLVKLGDFSKTQQEGALVKKLKVASPWAPPEVSVAVYNEGYHVHSSQDAWQLGILIFVCLTGSYPWSSADITDHDYKSWVAFLKRKTTKMPQCFRCFTPRLLRLLRRLLQPKPEKRFGVKEVYKYLSDPWLVKDKDQFDNVMDNTEQEPISRQKKSLLKHVETKLLELLRFHLNNSVACQEPEQVVQTHNSSEEEIYTASEGVSPS
nr:serine/threonine-protein kinase SBK1-like [Cherax quadricarinatus]